MSGPSPIELLWARVKGVVARQALLRRKTEETRQQTETAFSTITAADCRNLVKATQEYITSWMRSDTASSLSQYSDFNDLVQRLPDQVPDFQAPIITGEQSDDEAEA